MSAAPAPLVLHRLRLTLRALGTGTEHWPPASKSTGLQETESASTHASSTRQRCPNGASHTSCIGATTDRNPSKEEAIAVYGFRLSYMHPLITHGRSWMDVNTSLGIPALLFSLMAAAFSGACLYDKARRSAPKPVLLDAPRLVRIGQMKDGLRIHLYNPSQAKLFIYGLTLAGGESNRVVVQTPPAEIEGGSSCLLSVPGQRLSELGASGRLLIYSLGRQGLSETVLHLHRFTLGTFSGQE